MMKTFINFIVAGDPKPKQSFRYTKNGGGFTPASVKEWQQMVACYAAIAIQGSGYITGDLSVEMGFRLGSNRRVDLDNLSKAVLDAMNGIVYQDDRQVTRLVISKRVSKENPGVSVACWKREVKK